MGLDKLRWDGSEEGKQLVNALGDWHADSSLVFFDDQIKVELSGDIGKTARNASILDLKGIGRRQCWALPVGLLK
ncbi:MAG: hypothetical protein HQ523_13010 [Lentisphaerae bacterium]|nr:hypothetical protein [Lentisphaerota bacterium]